jgi:WD40 repeat protein
VRSVAVKDGARWLLTAGADSTVRLWDSSRKEQQDVAVFRKHAAPVVSAAFLANGTQTISGDRDVNVLPWKIEQFLVASAQVNPPATKTPPEKIPIAKD